MLLRDTAFPATEEEPSHLQLCQRGAWQDRLLVETVLSMLTVVCHVQRVLHRVWAYGSARLACTMAACHVVVQWQDFEPSTSGFVPRSMAALRLEAMHTMVTLAHVSCRPALPCPMTFPGCPRSLASPAMQ
jgi:hypothetical protein